MFNWGDWNFPGYHDTDQGLRSVGQPRVRHDAGAGARATPPPASRRTTRHGRGGAPLHGRRSHPLSATAHPNWVGMNHPKNPLHFAFELGGVDLGHTWTEGLLSYYYLTGDERGLEAARGIADYLVRPLAQRSRCAAIRASGAGRRSRWWRRTRPPATRSTRTRRRSTPAAAWRRFRRTQLGRMEDGHPRRRPGLHPLGDA